MNCLEMMEMNWIQRNYETGLLWNDGHLLFSNKSKKKGVDAGGFINR